MPVRIEISDDDDDDANTVLLSSNEVSSENVEDKQPCVQPQEEVGPVPIPVEQSSQADADAGPAVAKKSLPIAQEVMEVDGNDCKVVACFSAAVLIRAGRKTKAADSEVKPKFLGETGGSEVKPKKSVLEKLSIASQITRSVLAGANVEDEDGNFVKNGEAGFIKHEFPLPSADLLRAPDPVPSDLPGDAEFVSVRELALPGQSTRRTVPAGLVSFVLVEHAAGHWRACSIEKW